MKFVWDFLLFFFIYLLGNFLPFPADLNYTENIWSECVPELLRERADSLGENQWQWLPREVQKRKINLMEKKYGAPSGATALHLLSNDICMLRLNKGVMFFIHKAIKFVHLPHLLPPKACC